MTGDGPLSPDDFGAFFAALWTVDEDQHPRTPFRWQKQLVEQVADERRWPALLDLPTGSGKTAIIDVAVFLLAMDGQLPAPERWMPRRVAFVVDRRVIVDQADERATCIAQRITEASGGILDRVATGLRGLSFGGSALLSTVLRGGIVRDETWAQRPDVPAIISSTVDQVGSRLLFRGYGVSKGMRPIHAGLLGNDVLFVLDEVHLARPFAQTLRGVETYRSGGHQSATLPDRWQVVEMSATPAGEPNQGAQRFPRESVADDPHPVLQRRLAASKAARLTEVKVTGNPSKANEKFASVCAKEAEQLISDVHPTIGVIVNRVDTARRVASILAASRTGAVLLLTGRMRSLDRDRVLDRYRERLQTGRKRLADDDRLIVVATQSIEAGADFDLDGIVTECASLDALRQRFGRVDRDGKLAEAGTPSSSVVLARSTDLASTEDDPVYGTALRNTWSWLKSQPEVDFGIGRLQPDDLSELVPAQQDAPLLFPTQLDQWAQTSQHSPATDPDPSRWLHGLDASGDHADVHVIWRGDLDESLFSLEASEQVPDLDQRVSNRVASCPPASAEAMAVPIGAFRRWARGDIGSDASATDVPGVDKPEKEPGRPEQQLSQRVLRWSSGSGNLIDANRVRPGDTVLMPTSRGGIRLGTWDPRATERVTDLATQAIALQRRRAVVRLLPSELAALQPQDLEGNNDDTAPVLADVSELREMSTGDRIARLVETADWWKGCETDPEMMKVLGHLSFRNTTARLLTHAISASGAPQESYVLLSRTPLSSPGAPNAAIAEEDGRDATSFTGIGSDGHSGEPAFLDHHLRSVGFWAARMATELGSTPTLVDDLRLAGEFHDLGKADPRFQRWLRNGDELSTAMAGRLIAKSDTPDVDRRTRTRAREASGYPSGGRHELLSVSMLDDEPSSLDHAHDPELVRYLVCSHHGFGRYRFDPVIDSELQTIAFEMNGVQFAGTTGHRLDRLDSGLADLFWKLSGRYGWWGLAWLESVLRLADHHRSRLEQGGHTKDDSMTDESRKSPR